MNGGNFTKGPAAKNKKHRKLNRETEESMSEDETENNSGGNNPPNSKNSNNHNSSREMSSTSQNSQVKSSQNTSSNPRYVYIVLHLFVYIFCIKVTDRVARKLGFGFWK